MLRQINNQKQKNGMFYQRILLKHTKNCYNSQQNSIFIFVECMRLQANEPATATCLREG